MTTLKAGVNLAGITVPCLLGIVLAGQCYDQHDLNMVVTSVADSVHGTGSLHYVGQAFDIRTSNVPTSLRQTIRDEIAAALGAEFDVVLEEDHLHVEYQPKKGTNK